MNAEMEYNIDNIQNGRGTIGWMQWKTLTWSGRVLAWIFERWKADYAGSGPTLCEIHGWSPWCRVRSTPVRKRRLGSWGRSLESLTVLLMQCCDQASCRSQTKGTATAQSVLISSGFPSSWPIPRLFKQYLLNHMIFLTPFLTRWKYKQQSPIIWNVLQ